MDKIQPPAAREEFSGETSPDLSTFEAAILSFSSASRKMPRAFLRQFMINMEDQGAVSFIRRFVLSRRTGSGAPLGALPGDNKIIAERERFMRYFRELMEAWRQELLQRLQNFMNTLDNALKASVIAVEADIARLENAVQAREILPGGIDPALLLRQRRSDKEALVRIQNKDLPDARRRAEAKKPPPDISALEDIQVDLEEGVSRTPILSKAMELFRNTGSKISDVSSSLGKWLEGRRVLREARVSQRDVAPPQLYDDFQQRAPVIPFAMPMNDNSGGIAADDEREENSPYRPRSAHGTDPIPHSEG